MLFWVGVILPVQAEERQENVQPAEEILTIETGFQEVEVPGVQVEEGRAGDETDKIDGGSSEEGDGGSSGYTGQCGSGSIFEQIACKALNFFIDLRVIAYVIAGFGLVMFAWGAIFNKISWKHFSQIAIGLFLLSMTGPFITYFSGDGTVESKLGYGNFLDSRYAAVKGTGNKALNSDGTEAKAPSADNPVNEAAKKVNTQDELKELSDSIVSSAGRPVNSEVKTVNTSDERKELREQITPSSVSLAKMVKTDLPDKIELPVTAQEGTKEKKSFGWEDIKGAVTAGKNLVKNVSSGINTVKTAVRNGSQSIADVRSAIKNNPGGLDGLLNTASRVSGAFNRLQNDAKVSANVLAYNIEGAANSYQDMTSTEEERRQYQNQRLNGVAGNSGNKTTNKVAEWINSGGGSKILAAVGNAGREVSGAAVSAGESVDAANEGRKIGGDGTGAVFGAATMAGEIAEKISYSEKKKAAQENLKKVSAEYERVMNDENATSEEKEAARRAMQEAENAAWIYN